MNKYFQIFLGLIVLFPLEGTALKVALQAPYALLMDADSGVVLYEKKGEARCYPASLTKIATALFVLHEKGAFLSEEVKATSHALALLPLQENEADMARYPPYSLEISGSSIGLRVGETLSLETLLYGMLLASGNDASNVLAEGVGGSIDQFMKKLNLFLKKKGIQHTHFVNPHGLHRANHYTTPRDIAWITKMALEYPFFRKIVRTLQFKRTGIHKSGLNQFIQTNKLLKPGPYFYSKAIGVKTGYTSQAKYNLVAAAVHKKRTLIAVLIGCVNSEQRFKDALKLFETAFSEKPTSRVFFPKGWDHFTLPLDHTKKTLQAFITRDLATEFYPSENPTFRAQINWKVPPLPIKKNDPVGSIQLIQSHKGIVTELPLFALNQVDKTSWNYITEIWDRYSPIWIGSLLLFILSFIAFFLRKHKK